MPLLLSQRRKTSQKRGQYYRNAEAAARGKALVKKRRVALEGNREKRRLEWEKSERETRRGVLWG